jgi:glycosyltransferase involved in cell wall biosynthesis
MSRPVFSVITVVYNGVDLLQRTIDSVASQQEDLIEYIIVDGGSNDGTLDLIDASDRVDQIVSEPDQGIYDAMNKGLRMATGEYVWFMNCGDEINGADVARQLASFTEDILYGETMMVSGEGAELGLLGDISPIRPPKDLTWQKMNRGSLVCHQSFVVRRTKAVAYSLEFPFTADIDWQINCLKQDVTTRNTGLVLAKYLADNDGFSRSNRIKTWKDRYRVLKHHFGFLPNLINHLRIVIRTVF